MPPSETLHAGSQQEVHEATFTVPAAAPAARPGPTGTPVTDTAGGYGWPSGDEYRYHAPVAAVSFTFHPASVVRLFGALAIPVFVLGFAVAMLALFLRSGIFNSAIVDDFAFSAPNGIWQVITLGRSPNIVSWFACLGFFGSAAATALLARIAGASGDPLARDWRRFSWVLLLVSADQVCALHEAVFALLHRAVAFSPVLDFLWLPVASAALFFYFRPFLGCLPPPIRNRFVLASAIYFFGALGMELAPHAPLRIDGGPGIFEITTLVDRILQVTGLLLFMRTLVDHLTDFAPRFGVKLDRRK
jgi:hypothetical protein